MSTFLFSGGRAQPLGSRVEAGDGGSTGSRKSVGMHSTGMGLKLEWMNWKGRKGRAQECARTRLMAPAMQVLLIDFRQSLEPA